MPKNIIISLDGTGNEFGDKNSNVVKLYQTLVRDPDRQIAYYHPGLGTAGEMDRPSPWGRLKLSVKKILGLAFGYGIFGNIAHAYEFLMENYRPGDKIYLFGFSRGAYTAKALAALIHEFGILDKGNNILVEYAVALFLKPNAKNFKVIEAFQKTFGQDVSLHFVGLWDAVSSVGWAYDPIRLPFTWQNPDIKIGRHAMSIDERRCFFRQNAWGDAKPGQDLKQVWFPGVHSDIGGGYPEQESGLSKTSLQWMMREAEAAGLLIDQSEKAKVLGAASESSPPSYQGQLHQSLTGPWWLAEYMPKPYWDMRLKPPTKKVKLPLGSSRFIPESSVLHESAELRMKAAELQYKPGNLPKSFTLEK